MKYILATHGKMASGIKQTIEMLAGEQKDLIALDAYVDHTDFTKDFDSLINSFQKNETIFIFTDACYGSVNQSIFPYLHDHTFTLIAGINLPLVMEILMYKKALSEAEIEAIIQNARQQIIHVNPLYKDESPTE